MSRLVQAAKHYGCPKKRYKFEMHIHRVVLPSEKRKLFTRVLWSRGKKKQKKSHPKNQRFKTKWCEGVENYNINESIFDEATIYFTSNTNQIQSKHTKITLQIRERIDAKNVKFAKFELDLSKYVDITSPHRIFYQRLTYQKARKKAQIIFTIKSMELMSDGNISDYTDDDNDNESLSNYTDYNTDDDTESVLSLATLNTIQNATSTSVSKIKPKLNCKKAANIPALHVHSNISGNKLKKRYFDKKKSLKEISPTPSSTSSGLIITRRGDSNEFKRQFQFNTTPKHHVTSSGSHDRIHDNIGAETPTYTMTSSASDLDVTHVKELQRKLKLYEDKHKKYKYKYAKLCKKVEEQEIEQRCQQDQICRLKRVEDEVKDQYHTMAKYKKKVKSMSRERESLKKTLQKRNQTIINLNKENSKLKQQIMSLQTLESVRFNSDHDFDDNITEFNPNQDENHVHDDIGDELSDPIQTNPILDDVNDKTQATYSINNGPNGVFILTVNKNPAINDKNENGKDEESATTTATTNTPMTTSKDENSNTPIQNKPRRASTHIRNNDKNKISTELIQKLTDNNNTPTETNGNDIDGEKEEKDNNKENKNKPSAEIIKLVEKNNNNFKNEWMRAETEKLNYKKLYEKERTRVNHYKSKTSAAYKKYEKCEIELSINKHQLEELESKYQVMEEVYIKLKQDLTKMMDRYSKLEIEYEKIQNGVDSLTDDDYDSI